MPTSNVAFSRPRNMNTWTQVSAAAKILAPNFAGIAQFERGLIRDRVRSGLRHAKAKGKRLGRPRTNVNAAKIASLRSQGPLGVKFARIQA
jgi:DNA invertase Pin-like site-specific DNA recombinase